MYKFLYMFVVMLALNPLVVIVVTACTNGAMKPDSHPLLTGAALLVGVVWLPCWLWIRSLDPVTDKYCADALRS